MGQSDSLNPIHLPRLVVGRIKPLANIDISRPISDFILDIRRRDRSITDGSNDKDLCERIKSIDCWSWGAHRADLYAINGEVGIRMDLGGVEDLLDGHRPDGSISSFRLGRRISSRGFFFGSHRGSTRLATSR